MPADPPPRPIPPDRPRHALRRLVRAGFLLLPLVAFLWLFERWQETRQFGWRLSARIIDPPGDAGRHFLDDPELGWRYRPGIRYLASKASGEFSGVEVRTNTLGFRGPEPLPAGTTFRILCLGDSYVHACQVPEDRTFWSLLGKILPPARDGRPVETVNVSSEGYSTTQALAALRRYGPLLKPDLVILHYYAGNDTTDNLLAYIAARPAGEEPVTHRPYAARSPDGNWTIIPVGRPAFPAASPAPSPPAGDPAWRTLSLGFLPHTYQWLGGWLRFSPLGPWCLRTGLLRRHRLEDLSPRLLLCVNPLPEGLAECHAATRFLLGEIRRETERLGCRLVVSLIPDHFTVYPDRWRMALRGYPALGEGKADPRLPLRRLGELLEQEGIDAIDPFDALAAAARDPGDIFYPVDNHFTERGHAVYARLLAERILTEPAFHSAGIPVGR